jgi:predicted MPP superfamily phosphohydrolase
LALTRRQFLEAVGAGIAVLALPAPALAAPRPSAERVELAIRGLHPAHDGLRVAQLSDIHVGPRTPDALIRAAIETVRRFEPDLVFLTGDYVSHDRGEVGRAREILGGLPGPTFAVLGNHDHWVDAAGTTAALRVQGYEVLRNDWTRVVVRGEPLTVVGVDDLLTRHADVGRAFRGVGDSAAPLVLAHGPKTADELRRLRRPLLCFSGHTHGGQIALPVLTRLAFRLRDEPYLRGRYSLGQVQLYVNRGIGQTSSFRLDASPEVTLATLRAAPA